MHAISGNTVRLTPNGAPSPAFPPGEDAASRARELSRGTEARSLDWASRFFTTGDGPHFRCTITRVEWTPANDAIHRARVRIDASLLTTPNDIVTVIATQPLTNNEQWQKMQPGEFNLFLLGERIAATDMPDK